MVPLLTGVCDDVQVQELVPQCCAVVFDRANHWLYLEQPEEFNKLLLDFIQHGNVGRQHVAHVQ
jgi:pimeloyl-ACP methyl ester carboxylesterase